MSLSSPAPLFWEVIPYDPQPSPARPRKGCVGHFFDQVTRRPVEVFMGPVYARPVLAFRSAPSPLFDDEPKNILSWELEGADQNDISTAVEMSGKYPTAPQGQSAVFGSCSVSTTATNSHN